MSRLETADRPLLISTPLSNVPFGVVGIRASERISEPFQIRVEVLADAGADVALDELMGQPASLLLRTEQDRHFHGIIAEVREGDPDDQFHHFEIELRPAFALLANRVRSRIFQQRSVPEILRAVLDGTDVSMELARSYAPRNYCVQYQESDFAFASRLMEDEGLYYYFRHEAGRHCMVIGDDALTHPDVPGADEVSYSPVPESGIREPRTWHWNKILRVVPGKWTVRDTNFELPNKDLESVALPPESVQAGETRHRLRGGYNRDWEVFEDTAGYGRNFDSVGPDGDHHPETLQRLFDEPARVARLRMEEGAARAILATGHSNVASLCAGFAFNLTRHRRASGKYLLTHVDHEAQQGGFRSGEEASFRYENRFTTTPAGIPHRPVRLTPRPRIAGPQTATVVGPSGVETFLDKYGRVKVRFHWDRQGKSDGHCSCWVRVAQVWAGNRWGAFFWPRLGQEVVVAFEEGDPDRPLIVGSVYNAQNMPPFEMPASHLVAGIKSCSAGGDVNPHANFNGILFYDHAGDEHVEVHSERSERSRTETSRTLRAGQNFTTVVGALASTGGSGAGGGAGTLETIAKNPGAAFKTALDAAWGGIQSHLGKRFDFTVGTTAGFTLGSYGNYVVGAKFQIATHPGAFLQFTSGAPGVAFLQGFGTAVLGFVDMTVGGGMYPRYGPQIEVTRGPRLTTSGKASALATGLVAIVDGITVSANILAGMRPNMVDPFFIAAKGIEAATMGVLCGVEATLAWLERAEALTHFAVTNVELILRFQGYKDEQIRRDTEMAAEDMAKLLKQGAPGYIVQSCDRYLLGAKERLALLAEGPDAKITLAAHGILAVSENAQLSAKNEVYLWGQKLVTLNSPTIRLEGRYDGMSVLTVKDSEIAARMRKSGPKIELDDKSCKVTVGEDAHLLMTKQAIVLRFGATRIRLDEQGIMVMGSKIDMIADLQLKMKAPMMEQNIDGVVKQKGAVQQFQ